MVLVKLAIVVDGAEPISATGEISYEEYWSIRGYLDALAGNPWNKHLRRMMNYGPLYDMETVL